ncbi:MAG: serine hydrolase [Bacteroidetes bacterium]|nr:serine hydrolase [Bacteroidota bacterium]
MKRKSWIFIAAFVCIAAVLATVFLLPGHKYPPQYRLPFLQLDHANADSVSQALPIEEIAAHLMIFVSADSSLPSSGSLVPGASGFMPASISMLDEAIEKPRGHSPFTMPLFLSASSGIPDFLSEIPKFPSEMAMKAVANDTLISEYADFVAEYADVLGFHFNQFPQVSFLKTDKGEIDTTFMNREKRHSLAFLRAFNKRKIISVVSGFTLFTGNPSDTTKLKTEWGFFREFADSGMPAIALPVSHPFFTSETENFGREILLDSAKFRGLLIADATEGQPSADQLIAAFNNGADMIITGLLPADFALIITQAIEDDKLDEDDIRQKAARVFLAQEWCVLPDDTSMKSIEKEEIFNDARPTSMILRLSEASITLVNNKNGLMPIGRIGSSEMNLVVISGETLLPMKKAFENYASCRIVDLDVTKTNISYFLKNLPASWLNVIAVNSNTIPNDLLKLLDKELLLMNNTVVVNFGDPTRLKYFENQNELIQVFDDSPFSQSFAAQLIFGGFSAKGLLPLKVSDSLQAGAGIINTPVYRLKYTIPEELGISSADMGALDSIVAEALAAYAFPGCQVWVAKEGKVIYNKCFGHLDYERSKKVAENTLYDIASVTKVAATTVAAMKMADQGRLDINADVGKYFKNTEINYKSILPDTVVNIDTINVLTAKNLNWKKILKQQDTIHLNDSIVVAWDTLILRVTPSMNIFKTPIRALLIHQSGIQPSMPILRYIQCNKDTLYTCDDYYCRAEDDSCKVEIADNMYLRANWFDTLWNDTKELRAYNRSIYQYTDVNMILVQQVLDTINQKSLDDFLKSAVYGPLNLHNISFKPLDHGFKRTDIAPTEYDRYWRRQLLQGHVHDPSAALLGGISGNAGLFCNANNLGILLQMLLNGGSYGGVRIMSANTVKRFTSHQPDNHRGLGWDMKTEKGIIAYSASEQTYGHTGFTGTCVWVDPQNQLVFVFLSNRVHPKVSNWKILSLRVRQNLHQAVYDAIAKRRNGRAT